MNRMPMIGGRMASLREALARCLVKLFEVEFGHFRNSWETPSRDTAHTALDVDVRATQPATRPI